jgi:RHS repeat-associated protein
VVTDLTTKEYNYISCPYGAVAVIIKEGANENLYYLETDHLGSIIGLINTSGTKVESYSYDAWGRRRNSADWTYNNVTAPILIDRGFTGHEHLEVFGLINMNGRMYDPYIGRFLSVDPVIQFPDNAFSFSGYGYCFNNPLIYTDPSGYLLTVAEAYHAAQKQQYDRSFAEFQIDYYEQLFNYWEQSSGGGGGISSFTMTFRWIMKGKQDFSGISFADLHKAYPNDIILGDVIIEDYVKFHSITIDIGKFGREDLFRVPYYSRESPLMEWGDIAGYMSHGMIGSAALLTSHTTYRYAHIINGIYKTPQMLTAEDKLIWGTIGKTANITGGTIGTLVNSYKAINENENGETGWAIFHGSVAASYIVGIALTLALPECGVGEAILLSTMGVDVVGTGVKRSNGH